MGTLCAKGILVESANCDHSLALLILRITALFIGKNSVDGFDIGAVEQLTEIAINRVNIQDKLRYAMNQCFISKLMPSSRHFLLKGIQFFTNQH